MPLQAKPLPPAADLWERYSYNPLTGELFSRLHPRRKALGAYDKAGYLQSKIEWHGGRSINVMMHRLIWKWCHGSEPGMTIDHKDHNRSNNRIWNLRIADMVAQRRNRRGYITLTPDQEMAIVLRHQNGEPCIQIAKSVGLDRRRITKLVQDATCLNLSCKT